MGMGTYILQKITIKTIKRQDGRCGIWCLMFQHLYGWLVSWCFKPSQPQRIISGLRETFMKRYLVERTNKAELRPEEQREKAESRQENLWNEIQLKGP